MREPSTSARGWSMKREAALSTAKSAMRVVRVGGGNPGVSRHRGRAAVGAAADVHAGRLHAIEDAVELVPAVLVGGPHGLEIVELREVAEATVGRLRHGPLSVAMPAEALEGSTQKPSEASSAKRRGLCPGGTGARKKRAVNRMGLEGGVMKCER